MKVILISGKARNGKDTVASLLQDVLTSDGKRVLITHYADLLKYICRNYLGWDGNKDDNGRRILQYVGTDVIRKRNPTLWVDFIVMILQYFSEQWDYVIIPDCRFPNEITTMTDKFDAVHIRVSRSNFQSPLTAEQKLHPSETALDNVLPDYYMLNDGTLDDLKQNVTGWVKTALYKHEEEV